MANPNDLRELEKDPRLFLYTSLTAGSSHIITATSRLETILKANKIPFQAIDIATDEQHRRLWQRRAGKRKLPGLVKEGFVLGDLDEVEEWNEYGELKENIGDVPSSSAPTSTPAPKPPTASTATSSTKPAIDTSRMVALPGAAEIKARNNPTTASVIDTAPQPEKMTNAPAEKEKSIQTSIRFKSDVDKHTEHLSALPSAIPSAAASPDPASKSADISASGTESAKSAIEEPSNITATAKPASASSASGASTSTTIVEQLKVTAEKLISNVTEATTTKADTQTDPTSGAEKSSTEGGQTLTEQLKDTAEKLISSVTDATSTKADTQTEPASGAGKSSTESGQTLVEQLKETADKLTSNVAEATSTKAGTKSGAATGGEKTSSESTQSGDTVVGQLKDTANKVLNAASEAVQKNAPSASSTQDKTVPDATAASQAVESGEIDEGAKTTQKKTESVAETVGRAKESQPARTTELKDATPSTGDIGSTTLETDSISKGQSPVAKDSTPQTQAAADPTEASISVED